MAAPTERLSDRVWTVLGLLFLFANYNELFFFPRQSNRSLSSFVYCSELPAGDANAHVGGARSVGVIGAAAQEDRFEQKTTGNASLGGSKLRALRQLLSQNSESVVRMSPDDYHRFALTTHRPYHLFVLFVVDEAKICPDCTTFSYNYQQVAKSYTKAGKPKRGRDNPPIIFATLDMRQDQQLFRIHQFRQLPALVSLEEVDGTRNRANQGWEKIGMHYVFPTQNVFEVRKGSPLDFQGSAGFSPAKILEWVNMHSGCYDVELLVELSNLLYSLSLLLAAVCSLVFFIWLLTGWLKKWPKLMVIGAVLLQFLGTAGIFHSVSSGLVWMGHDRNSNRLFLIAKSSRAQFTLEGLLMAGALLTSGLSLVALAYSGVRQQKLPRGEKVEIISAYRERVKRNRLPSHVTVCLLVLLFAGLVTMAFEVYRYKTGWYLPTFRPPADYIRGPMRNDRGNMF